MGDLEIGALVLAANRNYCDAPVLAKIYFQLIETLFGRLLGWHDRFVHKGMEFTLLWSGPRPYLISIRETGPC